MSRTETNRHQDSSDLKFNMADARKKYTEAIGLKSDIPVTETEIFDTDQAQISGYRLKDRAKRVAQNVPGLDAGMTLEQKVESKLREENMVTTGGQIIVFDLRSEKAFLSGKFILTPKKYSELPLAG